MTKNIYELSSKMVEVLDLLQDEELQDNQQLLDTFNELEGDFEWKVEGYTYVIRSLQNDVTAIKVEEQRLAERRKGLERNIERMKDTLVQVMEFTGIEKVKTPRNTIWVQNNPHSLKVTSEEGIPDKWFIEQKPKLDKRGLLNHIKETGEHVDGVQVVQSKGVRFR